MKHTTQRRWFSEGGRAGLGKTLLAITLVAVFVPLTMRSAAWVKGMAATLAMSAVMAQAPVSGQPTIDPAIIRAADDYRTAVLAADARAVAAMYREDGIELPNCAPVTKGRAAIERRYQDFFAGPARVTAFTFRRLEATVTGDLAYDVGTYEQTVSLPGGNSSTDRGKYVAIVKRTEGAWKLAYLIYNSDTPQAASR
jgi:uncharacterized protein (TIGR02246 family)